MVAGVSLVLLGVLLQGPAAAAQADGSATVAGRVVEAGTNAPIAGATVRLAQIRTGPPANPPAFPPAFTPPPTATTDDAGRFVFSAVSAGRYMLSAQKPGYAFMNQPGAAPAARPIDVAAGAQVADAVITLAKGAVITGRVLDPNGQPLADARLTAYRRMEPPAGRGRGLASRPGGPAMPAMPAIPVGGGMSQSNDLGEFRIYSLPPGDYFIQAAPRFEGPTGSSTQRNVMAPTFYPAAMTMSAAQPVTVAAGQTFGEITIRMIAATAYQISGVVVDASGSPVAGALVDLQPDRSSSQIFVQGPPGRIKTDASGRFTIGGILDGTYLIGAAAPVVIARSAPGSAATGGGVSGGFASYSVNGGSVGPDVMTSTETANGVTTQFRTSRANQLAITVNGADVSGLQLVAQR